MASQSPKINRISLCWVTRTDRGYRYFPCIIEKYLGMSQAKHGHVMDKGQLREYPVWRYVLRSYTNGRKHYEPLIQCNPRDAYIALDRARKTALQAGLTTNRLAVVKLAAQAYLKELGQRVLLAPSMMLSWCFGNSWRSQRYAACIMSRRSIGR